MRTRAIMLVCVLLCGGCAIAPTPNQYYVPAQYVAIFNYSPPAHEDVRQGSALFALGRVVFQHSGKKALLSAVQFSNLEKAVAQDITEILTAKGFVVRGPFDSYDLISYADKKAVDFFLLPVVSPLVLLPEVPESPVNVTISMRIELREIITRELLWSKYLAFADFEVPLASVVNSYTRDRYHGKIVDAGFSPEKLENRMAREMEREYPVLMSTIYSLIDPEEMMILKKQAEELRSQKGY